MTVYVDDGKRFDYSLYSVAEAQNISALPQGAGEVEIRSAGSTFQAAITATGLGGEAWRAGFIQEIHYSARIGLYTNGVKLEDRIHRVPPNLGGTAMRDGSGDLPFDESEEDLVEGVAVQIESSDDPCPSFPQTVTVNGQDGRLMAINGRDEFNIWLAAARTVPDKRLILLARIGWRVHYDTSIAYGPIRFNAFRMNMVEHDAADFTASVYHPGGAHIPQCLRLVEANEFSFRISYINNLEQGQRVSVVTDPGEPPIPYAEHAVRFGAAHVW